MSGSAAVSAVLDTNLIVSAFLSTHGTPGAIRRALYRGAFHLVLSPTLRAEYTAVLARPSLALDPGEVATFFRFLARRARLVTPATPYRVPVRDPKDEHVLATALDGDAEYLVTGDADLLTLAGDPRLGALRIVTARAFLEALPATPAP